MKYSLSLMSILCLWAVCLFNGYGCRKDPAPATTQPPIDSTDTNKTASKNCIDSVVGSYYGWMLSYNKEYHNGTEKIYSHYDGLDTLVLKKKNDSVISVTSRRLYGPSACCFRFDTSGIMRFGVSGDNYELILKPATDSVEYLFGHSAGSTQNGAFVFSRFKGRK